MPVVERFALNRNAERKDVLHRSVGCAERHKSDDAINRVSVDSLTAAKLLDAGEARRCEHCWHEEALD